MTRPLIAIVGPTASGKTSAAVRVASAVGGEIICADSRTVFRGMDIGTAKPTYQEMAGVVHYGLDLVAPGEKFTVADFQRYAQKTIKEVRAAGKIPVLVGGSGLYIDAILFNYQFGQKSDSDRREVLNSLQIEEHLEYCKKFSIELPENVYNKRYLIRAIEQNGVNKSRNKLVVNNTYVFGLSLHREVLRERVKGRVESMFSKNVVKEAIELSSVYGWDSESMTGNVYRVIRRYIEGEVSLEEAKQLAITSDMQLAKRQMTWFKRNPTTQWYDDEDILVNQCIKCVQLSSR